MRGGGGARGRYVGEQMKHVKRVGNENVEVQMHPLIAIRARMHTCLRE